MFRKLFIYLCTQAAIRAHEGLLDIGKSVNRQLCFTFQHSLITQTYVLFCVEVLALKVIVEYRHTADDDI